ncbi:MAG: hypothetical protein HY765_09695, partial [Rhodomicrobium sp.]|nr:hypothetical protein [Rhodomicrobium sp.]
MASHFFLQDHKPGQNGNASYRQIFEAAFPPLSLAASGADIDFERNFVLTLGWPAKLVHDLELKARNAKVGLIQTAIASGVLSAPEFYDQLSRALSFAPGQGTYRVHLPPASPEAWLIMERPVPLAAKGAPMVALNAQNSSIHTLITLSQRLGEKRRHLKLLTRQELIDAVTRSHGRVLVARAVAGLMKERPGWSAKTGLAPWQAYSGAAAGGLALGSLAVAPREVITLSALLLSLIF